MKISVVNGELRIRPSAFAGQVRIPMAEVRRWRLFIDEYGRGYIYFDLDGASQGLALPTIEERRLVDDLNRIKAILGQDPVIEVEPRLVYGSGPAGILAIEAFVAVLAYAAG